MISNGPGNGCGEGKDNNSDKPRKITQSEKVLAITNTSEILRFSLITNQKNFQTSEMQIR